MAPIEPAPSLASKHNKLGDALLKQRQPEEAIAEYLQALQFDDTDAITHSNLGLALALKDKLTEAVAHFRKAIALKPNYPEAHNNLGTALRTQGKDDEAMVSFREALRHKPNLVEAMYNLGNALKDADRFDEALVQYRAALWISPNNANVHNNLGGGLQAQEKLEEAAAHYKYALKLQPDHAEAHRNLGGTLQSQGKLDEAMAHYDEAMRLRPDFPEAHHAAAILALARGDFARGWPEYEWRWRLMRSGRRSFSKPLWDGSDLKGRTILVYAEQGIGDTLQFIRYLPLVKQRGGTVVVECQPELLRLLAGFEGIDHLLPRGTTHPEFDVQTPLLSLPGIMHTSLATIPAAVPYLQVDAESEEQWRRELEQVQGRKIGIVWQGNPAYKGDRQRSMPLANFEPLAQVEGVRLISLQKGQGTDQLQALADRLAILDLGGRLHDFTDTAAVVKSLDLVISCDTAVAHLAGGLGIPVWIALPFAPDWRWLMERTESPWYPSTRLFRQLRAGQWDDVFARMASELLPFLDRKAVGRHAP